MQEALALTRNAERRSNQRGIRREVMAVLLAYGATKIRHGAEVVFMDRAARRKAREALGRIDYARLERALDTYLVVDGGQVLTCAHRRKPLRFYH
jgi:hypothetical protein